MGEVTQLLEAIDDNDPRAAAELLPLVYDELRHLAAARLAHEKPGQTFQATALVHEAFLRLVGGETPQDWRGRKHFFAAAAEAMRRILIDQARRKASLRAGGNLQRVDIAEVEPSIAGPQLDLLALDEALRQLEATDQRSAAVVRLRFFAGLTMTQIAEALSISLATVENDWAYAKCFLRLQLGDDGQHSLSPGGPG